MLKCWKLQASRYKVYYIYVRASVSTFIEVTFALEAAGVCSCFLL